MKKGRFIALFQVAMKISIIQLSLGLVFTFTGLARDVGAQSLLSREVSISANELEVKQVLRLLQKEASVNFIYSPSAIRASRKTSIHAIHMKLGDVLAQVLIPLGINFSPVEGRILLYDQEETAMASRVPTATNGQDLTIDEKLQLTVTGRVTTRKGESLPGVSVVLKGTSTGTRTDAGGNYSLTIPDGNGTLVFSYVGYTTQEITINNRTQLDLQLVEQAQNVQEVVVIGYQTIRRKDLTGATSVINPSAANRVIASNLAESIQGLSPGVTVRTTGNAAQNATIEIRGAASFINSSPLYVIDGMIADANPTINNDDIASIQILKDASAAAIYGSRAANGVVIITTKKGRKGTQVLSLSAKFGVQQIPKRWDVTDASGFAALKRQAYTNEGLTPPPSISTAFNPAINTNWQSEGFRLGNDENYNASLSGGSETSMYLVSGSYYTNKAVLLGNNFQRATLRINTETKKGILTVGENVLLSNTNQQSPQGNSLQQFGIANPFYDLPQLLPIIPVQGPQYISPVNPNGYGIGTADAVTYAGNPVAVNAINSLQQNFAKMVGNAYAQLKLISWLDYKFNAGAEVSFDFNKTIQKTGIWTYAQQPAVSSVGEDRSKFTNFLFEHTLNFNHTFGVHAINGVVGFTQQHTQRDITDAGRNQLAVYNNTYYTTIASAGGQSSADGRTTENYRINSFLGRVNYAYSDKYLITLTGREDMDSRFAPKYRTGFFPSAALAWRISKESFFQVPWINDLKINASYGQLGIVTVGSWDYLGNINNAPRAIFGNTINIGAYQAQLNNANLHWERRIVKNIGIDATVLDNHLSFTADIYNSLSKDALLALPLANYLGNLRGNPNVNAGSIRNSGYEVAATYRDNGHAVKWDANINFTTIFNKVVSVGSQGAGINYIQTGLTRSQVGHSLGEFYLRQTSGIFHSQAEIDAYVNTKGNKIMPNAKPGDVKYLDINGDGKIDDNDRKLSGSPWPKLQTGAQFNASYKGFNLNIQLVGIFGNKIYNDVKRVLNSYENTNFIKGVNPWSPTNTASNDPRIGIGNVDPDLSNNEIAQSNRWLESGSYIRLRNVELGYAIPVKWATGSGISTARIFVSGQNLITITKYSGLDPDVQGNGILDRGVDLGNWPSSRIYSIGLQIGF